MEFFFFGDFCFGGGVFLAGWEWDLEVDGCWGGVMDSIFFFFLEMVNWILYLIVYFFEYSFFRGNFLKI